MDRKELFLFYLRQIIDCESEELGVEWQLKKYNKDDVTVYEKGNSDNRMIAYFDGRIKGVKVEFEYLEKELGRYQKCSSYMTIEDIEFIRNKSVELFEKSNGEKTLEK